MCWFFIVSFYPLILWSQVYTSSFIVASTCICLQPLKMEIKITTYGSHGEEPRKLTFQSLTAPTNGNAISLKMALTNNESCYNQACFVCVASQIKSSWKK